MIDCLKYLDFLPLDCFDPKNILNYLCLFDIFMLKSLAVDQGLLFLW